MVTARDNLIGARLDQTPRVRDDPGLLWLRALFESRLRAPDLSARDQDTRNRGRRPMISDHGSPISRMMQV